MKIAYLANVRFPSERAHAVQIFHMCKAFSESGADLTLFVNKIGKGDSVTVREYFATDFNFKIERLTRGPFLPRFKPSYYFGEIVFALSFLMSQERKTFDVIYSRHEWIVWLLSLFINKDKFVWESHEAKFNFPARYLLKKGIKTVVISEGIFNFYKNKRVSEKQMLIAHDGIDESFFGSVEAKVQARQRLGLPQDKKIAMYIGGFDAWKGVETFFEAAALCEDMLFVAIGGSAEQVVNYKKRYPKVVFLGARPYSELKDNQQAADVLVIPNTAQNELSEKFTSPLKLFAHMTSGIPLVVSNVPSIVSVTGDELVTVAKPDNADSLAEGIKVILSNNQSTPTANKLKTIVSEYTWQSRARKIVDWNKRNYVK